MRFRVSWCNIEVIHPQYFARPGIVTSFFHSEPIEIQLGLQVFMLGIGKRNSHEIETLLASPNKTLRCYRTSSPDRWVGFLLRFGQGSDIADFVVLAVVSNRILCPGLEDHFQRFMEPALALGFVDVK